MQLFYSLDSNIFKLFWSVSLLLNFVLVFLNFILFFVNLSFKFYGFATVFFWLEPCCHSISFTWFCFHLLSLTHLQSLCSICLSSFFPKIHTNLGEQPNIHMLYRPALATTGLVDSIDSVCLKKKNINIDCLTFTFLTIAFMWNKSFYFSA